MPPCGDVLHLDCVCMHIHVTTLGEQKTCPSCRGDLSVDETQGKWICESYLINTRISHLWVNDGCWTARRWIQHMISTAIQGAIIPIGRKTQDKFSRFQSGRSMLVKLGELLYPKQIKKYSFYVNVSFSAWLCMEIDEIYRVNRYDFVVRISLI